MPVTRKQQRFMGACSTDKGRRKMKKKCPSKKVAREMRRGPIKST
jgi:hypothetical protein